MDGTIQIGDILIKIDDKEVGIDFPSRLKGARC
jgi:hypothetical protein